MIPKTLRQTKLDEYVIRTDDVANNAVPAAPRLRVNRTAALILTTNWQTVVFNGTSAYNVNLFPYATLYQKVVDWDSANNKFVFNAGAIRNYKFDFYYKLQGNLIAGLTNLRLQARFVIPMSSPQVAFPFPEDAAPDEPFIDLSVPALLKTYKTLFSTNFYTNAAINQYGLQFQVRQETIAGLLTAGQILNCNLIVSA